MIKVRNLYKKYGELSVLNGVNVDVKKGEVIAIIGPSGGGKSTFLRCLNLLETPTSGEIEINGQNILNKNSDINKIRQKVSMVFQHFNLFANKTVLENLTLAPVKSSLYTEEEAKDKAYALLKKVGLEDKAKNRPSQLSGGQQQRVSIARAYAG